jgi:PTS system mannose-specific IID component
MTQLPRRVRLAVLFRGFAVQGSWNYETLIGTGFAFSLLPVLRWLHGRDEAALRAAVARHTELFNSHPYFAPVAVGAVSRLEADGVDPSVIERFKSAMRGSLGSLGDQLVWSAWRPASMLLALALLLAGAAWWVGAAVFLTVYNALHLPLRVWGLRVGVRTGLEVGRVLRDAPLQRIAGRAADAGALLCGFAAVLPLAPLGWGPLGVLPVAATVALGLWLGLAARRAFAGIVGAAWAIALLLSWIA